MVSKKKRYSSVIEASDIIPKKSKLSEAAGTRSETSVMSTSKSSKHDGGTPKKSKAKTDDQVQESNACRTDGYPSKSPKREGGSTPKTTVEMEQLDQPEQPEEEVQENNQCRNENFPDWTQIDLLELMKRMERVIPTNDKLMYSTRAKRLEWELVSFGCHSAQECENTWMEIQKHQRKFRLLGEILEDAKDWATKPRTNFYRRWKSTHPDRPQRPQSSYMLFYMAMKNKVIQEHPGIKMTEVSKYLTDIFKSLPEKEKKKYTDMAATLRKEYEEKLSQFYLDHPKLIPKTGLRAEELIGLERPRPPLKLFLEDRLKKHENDPDFDKSSFLEKCNEQWNNMPDKKKIIWINWACEEEEKFTEKLKAYLSQNPGFEPYVKSKSNVNVVLSKKEKNLRDRFLGKPQKPLHSGYLIYCNLMLASDHMKGFSPTERMVEISRMWHNLPETQKKKYQERAKHMLDQYKLEYATYLNSLPEDKRQEELQSNVPTSRKNTNPKVKETAEGKKHTETKVSKHPKNETPGLYKGEPEFPPRNEYELFLKALLHDKNQTYSETEVPQMWQMLPDSVKAKYHKKLSEIKTKYMQDYEKFLNSLSREKLKEYSARKENFKKEQADASDDSAKREDSSSSDDSDDDDDDDDEEDQDSGSDNSPSDSESSSSDSSESNDGDIKNSDDSSSSVSDSD